MGKRSKKELAALEKAYDLCWSVKTHMQEVLATCEKGEAPADELMYKQSSEYIQWYITDITNKQPYK